MSPFHPDVEQAIKDASHAIHNPPFHIEAYTIGYLVDALVVARDRIIMLEDRLGIRAGEPIDAVAIRDITISSLMQELRGINAD